MTRASGCVSCRLIHLWECCCGCAGRCEEVWRYLRVVCGTRHVKTTRNVALESRFQSPGPEEYEHFLRVQQQVARTLVGHGRCIYACTVISNTGRAACRSTHLPWKREITVRYGVSMRPRTSSTSPCLSELGRDSRRVRLSASPLCSAWVPSSTAGVRLVWASCLNREFIVECNSVTERHPRERCSLGLGRSR